MPARFGVIVFPGSNCDHDAYHAAKHVFEQDTRFIWHKETDLGDVDVVVVPGGFSYGDYLRAGAIARFSPIMQDVIRFARDGGLVIGICNGFQVLCESGLLPGALMKNASLRFACKSTFLRVENAGTPFTAAMQPGQVLEIPVAHGEGNFYAAADVLDRLESNDQVVFRYCDADGQLTASSNPNGSARNIAGIVNHQRNVLGMMPHPERCAEPAMGRPDGAYVFRSLIQHFAEATV
jgi:phosphoribosylformylglycinamidine synthase subunit PurQ / glutaminase